MHAASGEVYFSPACIIYSSKEGPHKKVESQPQIKVENQEVWPILNIPFDALNFSVISNAWFLYFARVVKAF